jgi:hypothetical protein
MAEVEFRKILPLENEEGAQPVAMKREGMNAFHAEFCETFANLKRIEILDLLRECEMTVTTIMQRPLIVVSAMAIDSKHKKEEWI